jgi:hypothetical protein
MIVALAPSNILACECFEVPGAPDTREWLRETDGAIFVGEVLKIEELEVPLPGHPGSFTLERDVTFKVLKRWKRAESSQISIRTGIGGGDCGFPFVEGKQYFVSARQLQGRLTTGICSSTQKLSEAKKLIKKLDRIDRGR